ncbi:hypothetical protein HYH03_013376 [Edaphochlamys debaryana]|uniref:Uncharacterized protein n=1 Tax=Edaphochlamys debaryana TaxID=47281 RepID=A0A835XPY0_9CHLO|nr:hypothetical protein HYH03_013376 [Edaphochlamys debaryana]|eukprot:KAG2488073.1 hypothetical protein HYH03_013376 [Edaphochlamys debaryana]
MAPMKTPGAVAVARARSPAAEPFGPTTDASSSSGSPVTSSGGAADFFAATTCVPVRATELRTREEVMEKFRTKPPSTFLEQLQDKASRTAFSLYCVMGGPVMTPMEIFWFYLLLLLITGLVSMGAYKQLGKIVALLAERVTTTRLP